MLWEILLRLPPQPSSLPRASAVCRRWRHLVTDPKFHRQFRIHHRKPPLLGAFSWRSKRGIMFNTILDPPDRIPLIRFSLGRCGSRDYDLLDHERASSALPTTLANVHGGCHSSLFRVVLVVYSEDNQFLARVYSNTPQC
ncbi:uncharacterized protein [Lolium perenne]|uniref:uncharacterized protein n=1 Tax=Lolium perenne TaxID=4522 RepID=UPI0021F5A583|nr:uncharacterized protein LOC127328423 [Lolium perenne]